MVQIFNPYIIDVLNVLHHHGPNIDPCIIDLLIGHIFYVSCYCWWWPAKVVKWNHLYCTVLYCTVNCFHSKTDWSRYDQSVSSLTKTRSASRTNKQEWWIPTVKTKIKEASKNNIYYYKSILCNMYLCISFRLSQMVHSLSKISLANSKRKYQFNCMLQILPFTLLFNYLLIWYPDKSCYQIPYSLGMQDSCHLTLIGTLIPKGPH